MGVRALTRRALRRLAVRWAPPELVVALDFLNAASNPVFPKRPIVVADRAPSGAALVLSPHPDDEIIGPGGTLAMLRAADVDVTVLYLTDGGGVGGDRASLSATRRAEAEAVGRDLGVSQVFWDHHDTKLTNDAATVDAMRRLIDEVRPVHVYTPSFFDSHFDHFSTNQILVDALERTPAYEATVYGYEVWDAIPFANYVVDTTDWFERKAALMEHYATPLAVTDFTALARNRANVHFTLRVSGQRQRAERGYAEAFLRFDAGTYGRLHRDYVRVLEAHGSEQVSHLTR